MLTWLSENHQEFLKSVHRIYCQVLLCIYFTDYVTPLIKSCQKLFYNLVFYTHKKDIKECQFKLGRQSNNCFHEGRRLILTSEV